MKKISTIFLVSILFTIGFTGCSKNKNQQPKEILVVVENRLAFPLKQDIEQYKSDLINEGYAVKIETSIDSKTPPRRIRKLLQDEYEKDKNLEGAVFVGNIPSILFNTPNQQGDPYWNDYLCDFYYMDLNGVWMDSDNNGVYDEHRYSKAKIINWLKRKFKSNLLNPEIWVSRIKADNLPGMGDEITLLKNYFNKIHNYRTGKLKLPPKRAFLVADGVDVLRSGWGARPGILYSNVDVVQCQDHPADSLRKFLSSPEGYEWGIINVFSGPRIHHFDYLRNPFSSSWWNTKQTRKNIALYSDSIHKPYDISWMDIKELQPKVLFYHLLCSETGRFNFPDYLAGDYIFSGSGLIAIAGTQHSGAVGVPALYESLKKGKDFGEAWKDGLTYLIEHMNDNMTIYWCDHKTTEPEGASTYKAVLIGDGTLKLPLR
jgi:hypothetical protein